MKQDEKKEKRKKERRSLTNHPIWKSIILLAAAMSSGFCVAGSNHKASTVMPILPCCSIYYKDAHQYM